MSRKPNIDKYESEIIALQNCQEQEQEQEPLPRLVGGMMEEEEIAGSKTLGRNWDRPDFILSNSVPLQRSQTFDCNFRPEFESLTVRRRNSNAILREVSRNQSSSKTVIHNLRLPSFEALGIAARFSRYSPFTTKSRLPDQPHNHTTSPSPTNLSPKTTTCPSITTTSAPIITTSQVLCPSYSFAFPPTPPEERSEPDFPELNPEVAETQQNSHPKPAASTMSKISEDKAMEDLPSADPFLDPDISSRAPDALPDSAGNVPDASEGLNHTVLGSWLEGAIETAIATVTGPGAPEDSYRVISQTLPSPPTTSALESASSFSPVYQSVTMSIHAHLQPGQSPYINLTHAMPPKSILSSLPQSPPSTPRFPSGEDYFSSTVFSSAAPVPSYHDFHSFLNRAAPPSPSPLVPPSSIHVAVVERYIPPSSTQEILDLFSGTGPSVLLDRLTELSPKGGNLIFLFPTRNGALTFKNEYLGPILDPLLRQIITLNDLSSSIATSIGQTASIDSMPDFETLKRQIATLCRRLNRPIHSSPTAAAPRNEYSLVHASTGVVPLARTLWSEWWVTQESERVKTCIQHYWRSGQRIPSDKSVTAGYLWRRLMDDVKTRPYDEQPAHGIEMGVFVIRRSK